jgi:arylsulfatase A-like enzyme
MALLLAFAPGCRPPSPVGANVLLIGIDTLRADHLGCYGYPRPTSPRIDALCEEAVVFETAISQSPWTLPAFASIFTGVIPSSHRAGEGKVAAISLLTQARARFTALHPSRETLATRLRRAGWRTASFVSNSFVGPDFGLTRGFQDFVETETSDTVVKAALAWLEQHARERFFLFLHIIDPHQPYSPPRADAAPFIDPAYNGPLGLSYPATLLGGAQTEADRRRVIDLYDGEVRFVDRLVGRVLDALGRLGVKEQTLIVVTSDHGEGLFEHGHLGHGQTLYDELLHVPLIVRFPGRTPKGRVSAQVRTLDIAPTVLDAIGITPPSHLDGVSLMPLARGDGGGDLLAFAEYLASGVEQKALRERDRKLVFTPSTREKLFFDLRADPDESRSIAPERREIVNELTSRLEEYLCRSLDGFNLRIARGRKPHRVEVRLRTRDGFVDAGVVTSEHVTGLRLGAGRRLLEASFELPAAGWGATEEGIRFRTRNDGAVELRIRVDGRSLPRERIKLGNRSTHPRVGAISAGQVRVYAPCPRRFSPAADGEVSARLSYTRRPAAPTATVKAETVDRLRALGYVE